MIKILLIVFALFVSGCNTEKQPKTETVKIKQGCYYYLTDADMTVYDIYCTDADKNSNGIITVTYNEEYEFINIIKLEDDK